MGCYPSLRRRGGAVGRGVASPEPHGGLPDAASSQLLGNSLLPELSAAEPGSGPPNWVLFSFFFRTSCGPAAGRLCSGPWNEGMKECRGPESCLRGVSWEAGSLGWNLSPATSSPCEPKQVSELT